MKSALNLSSGGVLSYFPRLPSTLVTPPPSLPGFILGSLSLLSSTPSLSLRFLILLLRDSIILLLFPSSSSSSSSTPRRPPPAPHLHSSLTLSRTLSLPFSLSVRCLLLPETDHGPLLLLFVGDLSHLSNQTRTQVSRGKRNQGKTLDKKRRSVWVKAGQVEERIKVEKASLKERFSKNTSQLSPGTLLFSLSLSLPSFFAVCPPSFSTCSVGLTWLKIQSAYSLTEERQRRQTERCSCRDRVRGRRAGGERERERGG